MAQNLHSNIHNTTDKPSSTMSLWFSPLFFLLLDLFFSQMSLDRLFKTQKFFSRACFSIRSKLGFNTYSYDFDEGKVAISAEEGGVSRGDAEMVMGRLGVCCSPEGEELPERWSSGEFIGLFDEKEPSLEEVKEAFDVFDENRDGFIDAKELQRVMCVLGLKEGSDVENCERMIRGFDRNADGRIDFSEFVKFMEVGF